MTSLPAMRRAIVAMICVGALAGCTNGGPVVSRPSTFDSQRVLAEVGQLWVSDSHVPGYGGVFNLASPPSLYATAWNLRLALRYRIAVPGLSVVRIAEWLRSVIDTRGAGLGIAPMESIRLAAQALADLGQIPAKSTAAAVESLRGPGGLYRFGAAMAESWGATSSAFDAMQAAAVPIPAQLETLTAAGLRTTTSKPDLSPAVGLDELIPEWQIGDRLLPLSERAPLRAALIHHLGSLAQVVAGTPPNGVSAYVAASLVQIAAANGFTVAVPEAYFTPLIRPDGMLASSIGDTAGDPKTTFYAALIGRPLQPSVAATLIGGAGPMGWRADVGDPDSQSSFYAAAVVGALRGQPPADQLVSAARAWLGADGAKISEHPDATTLKNAFFSLELEGLLRAPWSQSFLETVRVAETVIAAGDPGTVLWGALVASRYGVTVSSTLTAAVRRAITHTVATSISVVSLEWEVARGLGLDDVMPALRSVGIPAPHGKEYVVHSGLPTADIASTALGYFANGGTAEARNRAALTFADGSGYWLTAPDLRDGNVVDLRTMYLGLWLSGLLPVNLLPVM